MGAYASEPLTFFYTCPHVECVCEGWCGCVCVPYLSECVFESMLSLMRPHMSQWLRMRTSSMVAYATIPQSFFMNLSCDECVFEWMLSLMRPHMSQWVRIWMTCGCVYGWRVGAYMDDLWVRMKPYLSRFLWTFLVMSAYSNECCPLYVRIWVNGCVYGWLVGAYRLGLCVGVGLGLGVNNAYKSVWCVSTK